jgi:hypothetical protein
MPPDAPAAVRRASGSARFCSKHGAPNDEDVTTKPSDSRVGTRGANPDLSHPRPERLREADGILSGDDPRQAQVEEFVHQISTSAITWDEFAKRLKKGLIKDLPPTVEPVPQDAVPLADALALLDRMLSESKDRSVQAIAQTFFAFAARPVAASPPLHVENDMCLFQWGRYDSGGVSHFECDFTRQFVLEDADGDYDHMEQLSLTLLFTPDESGLAELGSGELWSGDDLNGWTRQVAEHKVLLVIRTKPPTDKRLNHSEV